MPNPKVVDTRFQIVTLEPGTHFWCACGESKNQPFCDGSHQSTGFQPRKIEVARPTRMKLCLCKHTKSPNGVCDGSHFNVGK